MKKLVCLLCVAMILSLTGCGGNTSSTASEAGPSSSSVMESSVSQNEDSPTSAEQTPQYYFKDNELVTADVKIKITDYKVIQPGEEGNEYGDVPVIAFWYDTTNLSGKDSIDPTTAWVVMFEAIQDNDPNFVNSLEMGMHPDDSLIDNQLVKIKKDGTVSNAVCYELDDVTTPVTLKATRGIGGESLGEQVYEIS